MDAGDEEAMMPDWEFVEILNMACHQLYGFGFGERLFAFLMEKPIRETQTLPLVQSQRELLLLF